MRELVVVDHTPCNFGGRRPWWRCPECGRRAAILYLGSLGFRCRRCNRLKYRVLNEDAWHRSLRRVRKVRRRLGLPIDLLDGSSLTRPRYMHHATFDDLWCRFLLAEQQVTKMAAAGLAAIRGEDLQSVPTDDES